jgi:hypothetical protein
VSHDLDIVLREWPAHDAFDLFLADRPDVLAEVGRVGWIGDLSGGPDNLAVSRADGPNPTLFLCYGPVEPDEDVLEDYGEFVGEIASLMTVAVPFGRGNDAHAMAFVFSEWLAEEYGGVVIDPRLGEVIWPKA